MKVRNITEARQFLTSTSESTKCLTYSERGNNNPYDGVQMDCTEYLVNIQNRVKIYSDCTECLVNVYNNDYTSDYV